MDIKKEKYKNALLYFISRCGNEKLGKTKLNKLFYYLDFISYRDRKKSITGEKYVHLPMGPFAQKLEKVIKEAEKEKLIKPSNHESAMFGTRSRYEANVPFDISVFDEYEQKLLKYLCNHFKEWSTEQMIAQTHSEAPWVFSRPSDILNYKDADDIELFTENKARK